VISDPGRAETAAQPAAAAGQPGRRTFLRTSALAGAGALVAQGSAADAMVRFGAGGGPDAASGAPAAAWNALRRKLSSHRLIQPGQRGYTTAKLLYDPRYDGLRPAGIAYCRTPADIAACLAFATRYRVPVRARSGGHSYGGWSSVTGGLIADVTEMDSFTVLKNGTVRVGTGTGLLDFYRHLARHGLAVPGGSCPTVGIAGLTLGGGVGVLSRIYGLSCDALESVQIVTASGSVLTANSGQHRDLYWACRGGGGGNFGIATSFTFRAHPLRRLVLFFLTWPWSQAARVVDAWQSWAPFAPDALWSNLHLSAAPGGLPQIGVGGTYAGSISGAARQLGRLYARAGSRPSGSFLQQETYLNAMLIEAGCSAGQTVPSCLAGPAAMRVPSYNKSDFFTRKLNAAGLRALIGGIERLRHVHGTPGGVGAVAFDACGGAINRVRPGATAFVHRNALFLAQYSTSWGAPGHRGGIANQHAWLRSYYAAVHPHASGQAYQNYADPDLTNWQQAYYGANYPMLQQVKAKYDPHDLFTFPQAITG
jgi:FAD/FMN-containing dehydrogenase